MFDAEKPRRLVASMLLLTGLSLAPSVALSQVTAFKQAVAVSAAEDDTLSAFYRETGYEPLWTGRDSDDKARREAFLSIVAKADLHGLPRGLYDESILRDLMASARSERDRGRVEVALSRLFLRFARDIETGILAPNQVDGNIKREAPLRDGLELLRSFERARPNTFLEALTPGSVEYTRLVREKVRLEQAIARGGLGALIPDIKIEPGQSGPAVVSVRDRLIALGYLGRSDTSLFDDEMRRAVERFQADHGLAEDGIVGGNTLSELNRSPVDRLGHVLVSMERERWMNRDLGQRHVWVNLTDFKAKIVVDGETFFETKSVIGKDQEGRRTPEFSDVMEHMVINPSWYVPRSIAVNEYLPTLKRNPYALSYLEITDRRGRKVNRGAGFSQFSARSFPYSMRQPPSSQNALGLVKFMFPNKYNIYLHDTPAKNLFSNDVRAFSHGCIRLNDPFEFAYALLSMQTDNPEAEFQRHLRTGRESRVNLENPLPVHLVYRTAIAKPEGGVEYRRDVYGRNARVLNALLAAGVVLPGAGS
ncbi:L,D-transpeptidase family protein [Maribius pontilimi]|uniref:L,D-transpeptidase family protein n=1 Tax=Palleronia pontilimi TaxID=1964209 RepID=A0A934IEJ9_9RHOB|nr:L,D-transpeptidase family protein [Palleronia pontilimi]MBJ3762997.1 L,D-transpeptidase family protein [Palleronia pontilimi]